MFTAALIGRANVGKSTLFNRLISKNKAVVSQIPGTTRDLNFGEVFWDKKFFQLIDTGGLDIEQKNKLEKDVVKQALLAQKQAHLILLVIDVRDGLLPQDKTLIKKLRQNKSKKQQIFLIINKADSAKLYQEALQYQGQDFNEIIPVSATTGKNTNELLDKITKLVPKNQKSKFEKNGAIKVCIAGKPNVGKSSLFNSLIGEERVLVSETPHTTRDAQDTEITYKNKKIILIDTAGYRRKLNAKAELIEKLSVRKTIENLKQADIAILLLDISEKLSSQDARLSKLIKQSDCGLIIIGNKFDIVQKENTEDNVETQNFVHPPKLQQRWASLLKRQVNDYIKKSFPYLSYAPLEIISAEKSKKKQLLKILNQVFIVHQEMSKSIPQKKLDEFISNAIKSHRPSRGKGVKHPKIFSFKQVQTCPQVFELQIKINTRLHKSYLGYLEKRLRQEFGFLGTHLWIKVKR